MALERRGESRPPPLAPSPVVGRAEGTAEPCPAPLPPGRVTHPSLYYHPCHLPWSAPGCAVPHPPSLLPPPCPSNSSPGGRGAADPEGHLGAPRPRPLRRLALPGRVLPRASTLASWRNQEDVLGVNDSKGMELTFKLSLVGRWVIQSLCISIKNSLRTLHNHFSLVILWGSEFSSNTRVSLGILCWYPSKHGTLRAAAHVLSPSDPTFHLDLLGEST